MNTSSKIQKKLTEYANQCNAALTLPSRQERKDKLNEITYDMFTTVDDSALYFSREAYIHWNCNENKLKSDLLDNPDRYMFSITEDYTEHPGITIHFKNETINEL